MLGPRSSVRPASLKYESLGQLYAAYDVLFLARCGSYRRVVTSTCGLHIHLFDRHFLHLCGLSKEGERRLDMRREKDRIVACTEGFGDYGHDPGRSMHLPATLDCLLDPDVVVLLANPQVGTHAFFKHFGDRPHPVIQVLVGPSQSDADVLFPVTSFPTKLNHANSRIAQATEVVWSHEMLRKSA